jgi:hypothetical protein
MATAVPAGSPPDTGVAHVPSPRQNVPEPAAVPLLRFATARLPVMFADVPLALPVNAPTKSVEVTDVRPVSVVSKFTVTAPEVPPPFKLVPAVTPSISPAIVAQVASPLQ